MRIACTGLLLLGACSFGVDGDFADTEAGLVSVEDLQIDSEMAAGDAVVASVRPDDLDLIVTFEVDGMTGELRFTELLSVMERGGTGTLRLQHDAGWSGVQTVSLSASAEGEEFFDDLGFFGDQDITIEFETLVGNLNVTGSFQLLVAEGYDC